MVTSGEIVGVDDGQVPYHLNMLPLSGDLARWVSRLAGYAALASVCGLIGIALI